MSSLLRYDCSGVSLADLGITDSQRQEVDARLLTAREQVVSDDLVLLEKGEIPAQQQPLDAAFFRLPEELLADYEQRQQASQLGCILQTANRLRETVDAVALLGIGGSYMGTRALMEACCPAYYNELSRQQRNGCPRLYFGGNSLDNDATSALINRLGGGQLAASVEERWAIVVISKSGATLETATALRQMLPYLQSSCGDHPGQVAERVVPVTGNAGRLGELADQLGCQDRFSVPDGVGGRFSILSAVGLLPAAILGLDIISLLRGAAEMNEHFRQAELAENVVLQYAAMNHLLEVHAGATTRVLSVWSNALNAVGLWYDQLLAESLGKEEQGATPLTTVNTQDLHSRAQQHQEGRRDKMITNLIVERPGSDPLSIGPSTHGEDPLDAIQDRTLPELNAAAIAGTNRAYQMAGRPTADLLLPVADESSLGQFFQMMMLATVVEGKLLGINPYGQPGVEMYKANIKEILGL
jgi:glucose-6-phosphate isomerase